MSEAATKRLKIADTIAETLDGSIEGMVLGGSTGLCPDSVRENSDLDLTVLLHPVQLRAVVEKLRLKEHPTREGIDAFERNVVNAIKISQVRDGVAIDLTLYGTKAYEDFVAMEGVGGINIYQSYPSRVIFTQTGFDGKLVRTFHNSTKRYGGFVRNNPVLSNCDGPMGLYYMTPMRQDVLFGNRILIDDEDIFEDLEQRTWDKTIAQLVHEAGRNINLDTHNVLNASYSYTQGRLSPKVIERIQARTKAEVKAHLDRQ